MVLNKCCIFSSLLWRNRLKEVTKSKATKTYYVLPPDQARHTYILLSIGYQLSNVLDRGNENILVQLRTECFGTMPWYSQNSQVRCRYKKC